MEFTEKETKHVNTILKNLVNKFYYNLRVYYSSNAISKNDLTQELETYRWTLIRQFEEKGRTKEDYLKAVYQALRNKAINLLRSSVIFHDHMISLQNQLKTVGYNRKMLKKKEEKGIYAVLSQEEINEYLEHVETAEDEHLFPMSHPSMPNVPGFNYKVNMTSFDILLTDLFGERDKEILKKKIIENYTLEELAEEFCLTPRGVKFIVDNCLKTLRLRYPSVGTLIEESHKFLSGK